MSEREPKKIALVGTSSVGKTTVLEHFKRRYIKDPTVVFVEEAARTFFVDNPNIAYPFSEYSQRQVQSLALQNEEAAHLGNPRVIICDRSVVDAVAYVRGQGDIEGAERLYRRVIGWLPTYHALLLLDPVGVPYKTDNIRKEAMEERDRFHETFLAVFREKDIPFELISGTLRQRIEEIINS